MSKEAPLYFLGGKAMAKKKVTVKINGKDRQLSRGIKTFKDLGLMPGQIEDNLEGLGRILLGIKAGEPFVLSEILKAALSTEEDLSDETIETYVFEEADTEKLGDTLLDFFKDSAFKKAVTTILTEAEAAESAAKAQIVNSLSEAQN